MNKAILIIDCQYDFINGTLPVPNAEPIMNELANYLKDNKNTYQAKMFTLDWHPDDHCSFTENGGKWPKHCVRYSQGAAIYQKLLDTAHSTNGECYFLQKGRTPNKEEYSVFDSEISKGIIRIIMMQHNIDELDICGLAGDVCVTETIKGAVKEFGTDKIKVLTKFSPSIDDGSTLTKTIKDLSLKTD